MSFVQLIKAQMRNSAQHNWNGGSNDDNLARGCLSLLLLILSIAFIGKYMKKL